MASRLNPYLNVDGNAAQATEFYHCRLPSADCRIPVAPGPKRSPSCSTLLASVVRLGGVRAHNRHPFAPPQPQVRCDGRVSPHRVSRACR